jgi:N-acyl-D-aspartate/D-glutamate deacylase
MAKGQPASGKLWHLPASRMDLSGRGFLAKDYKADIVIWEPDKVQDNSTDAHIHHYSTGIDFVIVNGILVIVEGKMTGVLPDRGLKIKT